MTGPRIIAGAYSIKGQALSAREQQMTDLFVSGKSLTEISKMVFLSKKTVGTYLYRAQEKLGARNEFELRKIATPPFAPVEGDACDRCGEQWQQSLIPGRVVHICQVERKV